jgi:hypothetical protein
MPDGDLEERIRHGREERNLEYKETFHWARGSRPRSHGPASGDPAEAGESRARMQAKIAKSVLAMANLPDGGDVVIGMRKEGTGYVPEGMPPEDRDSFDQDGLSDVVNGFASPYVELTVSHVPHEGRDFVVIQVKPFDGIPIICKKNGEGVRRGAIYTRARRKIETVEVPSEVEMREILDRATEHRLRAYYATQARIGATGSPARPTDEEQYDEERHGL